MVILLWDVHRRGCMMMFIVDGLIVRARVRALSIALLVAHLVSLVALRAVGYRRIALRNETKRVAVLWEGILFPN